MENEYIVILGDICPEWGFPELFATGNPEEVFHDILPILKKAKVAIANLEAPLTCYDKKLKKNSVCLKGYPENAKLLSEAGIKGVSLANNHILDYCINGYHDTLLSLDENNIFHYGTSYRQEMPYCFQICGKTIGILAFAEREFNSAQDYGEGANCWNDLTSPQIIEKTKKKCDFLIIQYHGGIEHYIYPSPILQKKCRVMAEMGADLILCQHSHCIGTRENWNGCEILYGQGNTIFGFEDNNDSWNTGLIVKVDFNEKPNISYIPITATPKGELLADSILSREILSRFKNESEKIVNGDFIRSKWTEFCNNRANHYLPMAFARGRIFNKLNRITKGLLIKLFTNGNRRRNVMNLIRCDAHREVLQTILEHEYYVD